MSPAARSLALYAGALALGAFALALVEYHYAIRMVGTEAYIVLVAAFFTGLGIWAGRKLTPQRRPADFQRNDKALQHLGITPREFQMLERIAAGGTNKHIARDLGTSPNTVKAQISSLFSKLGCSRRTEALQKARALRLIP